MKAVIIAGGLSTCLAEETVLRPKPMVEIGGKPMRDLAAAGQLAAFRHDGFWQPMNTLRDKNLRGTLGRRSRAMEAVVTATGNPDFWRGRRVFLTGHPGFKGAWLSLWLQRVGAGVTAFSPDPPTQPNLFEATRVAEGMDSRNGDIRDYAALASALRQSGASIVFHLSAQATVADGYRAARDTFATNLRGRLNLLDAIRGCPGVEAAVIVTREKCYAPTTDDAPLQENAPFGGRDPYSASKSCAEIAVQSWRESFFGDAGAPKIATVRAGNVIGGGDWGAHRLLAERLTGEKGAQFACGWNFAPCAADHLSVAEIAKRTAAPWGAGARCVHAANKFQKESLALRLDASRARTELGWKQHGPLDTALRRTVEWYQGWARHEDIRAVTLAQLEDNLAAA
ncbi:MAG: CDP-glucose 4 6-dehydratase [Rhodocyclaceae bacterium]|nr:MAG: CDP-glucose 4 6-dehydratase [Rhodocyclaceae bacterium]TND04943.1 MAG: CDP-glucose 4,6-dehydratase [Rhodocyclaceae bacterium]